MSFIPSKQLGGAGAVNYQQYPVASATVIAKNVLLKMNTDGTGVETYSDYADADVPAIGVSAETSVAGETTIKVYDDPNTVYEWRPARILSTTTGGDATSWIDSSLTAPNDTFIGGTIVIVSTNDIDGFNVGDVLTITDFANSGGDCTVTGAGGTIAAGMTGYLYLGSGAVGHYGFDLDSAAANLNLDSAGAKVVTIREVKQNPDGTSRTFVKLRLANMSADVEEEA